MGTVCAVSINVGQKVAIRKFNHKNKSIERDVNNILKMKFQVFG